jgi:FMN reductase
MLGGDLRHSLAVEVALKPVLTELGLTCPTRGLFLVDSNYEDADVLDSWSAHARPQVAATMGNLR